MGALPSHHPRYPGANPARPSRDYCDRVLEPSHACPFLHVPGEDAYSPTNRGSRFSMNARTASRLSTERPLIRISSAS